MKRNRDLNNSNRFILKLQCPDQVGIVAKVTALIAKYQGSIVEASQFGDLKNEQFFMRVEISEDSLGSHRKQFEDELPLLAELLSMRWSLTSSDQQKKIVIFAGKQEHCLSDLLSRCNSQDLDVDLLAVVSNYRDHENLVKAYGVNYHYIPFDETNNNNAFTKIEILLQQLQPDLIILARFMRILPSSLCETYPGRIINIHHSFLPSFIGANPYEQAFDKGVKMIGK